MYTAKILLLIALFSLIAPRFVEGAPPSERIEVDIRYDGVAEVKNWASRAFFGGHEVHAFDLNGKRVIVVIGSPTSGVVTSEVFVFSGKPGEKLEYIVHRSRFLGMATARVKVDFIEVVASDREGRESVILVIPSAGV